MQRVFAIFVCCAFAFASAQAPFLHTHKHSDPHDHGGPLHSHVKHAHSHEAAGELSIHGVHPDDDAQMLDSFTVLKSGSSNPLLALVAADVPVPVFIETDFVHSVIPQGHDPPDLRSAPARAPPA